MVDNCSVHSCPDNRGHNRGTRQTRKIYGVRVNCLPHDITEQQLRAYFDQYGTIESVVLIRMQSRGFVNFFSLPHAQEAAEAMNGGLIGGKVVECKASTEPRYRQYKPAEDPPAAKQIDKVLVKTPSVAKCTVKVSCIAKATTERTLFNLFCLEDGEDPESIRIIRCPDNPFNHAFVMFFSQADAEKAAKSLDHVHVDASQIRVKLHPSKDSAQQPGTVSQTVLPSLTSVPHPDESGSRSKQRRQPRSSSASKPVKFSVVIQPAPKTSDTSTCTAGPSEISCSPLVASILRNRCRSELERLQQEHQVSVTLKLSPACITISGKREKVANVEEQLRDLKEGMEKEIIGRDFNLPFHCVPLFEQDAAMQELRKIEASHGVEFNVRRGTPWSSVVSIGTFSDDVKQCFSRAKNGGGDTIPSCSELGSYFSQSSATGSTGASVRSPRWFFKDDGGIFVEYMAEQSTKLEGMFQAKLSRPLLINRNFYTFDFTTMTQRNVESGRSRAIERQVQAPDIKRMVILRVTGLPSTLDSSIRELRESVKTATIEKECKLYDDSSDSFKKRLLANVNKYFVTAQLAEGRLKLKGIPGYVERVYLAAEEEKISEREVQIHAAMRGGESEVPTHWRPQSEEVILDLVKQYSEEWRREVANVRKTLQGVTVVRLERIQNKWLWERYLFARKRMVVTNRSHVNERHLFHGTRKTEPEKVFRSEKGVDFRFSGEGLWGTGSYFAVNASYSDAYAYVTPGGINEKQMFICQVLTGDCYDAGTRTDQSLRQPPLKSSQGHEEKRYDSVKGFTNGSYVYVVYDHEKVYPAYLVTYSTDGLPYVPSSYSYQHRQAPPAVPPSSTPSKIAKKDSCLIS